MDSKIRKIWIVSYKERS